MTDSTTTPHQDLSPVDEMPATITRELLATIVDEVFDGAIEDAGVIKDIYRVIARRYSLASSSRLRVTGFRGNPLRVVLSSGQEAAVTQNLIDAFASPMPFDAALSPTRAATGHWIPDCNDPQSPGVFVPAPAPVDHVVAPFNTLCYGARFRYQSRHGKVWTKIGHDLIAEWDADKVADAWIGQTVCSFSEDGDLSWPVYLVGDTAPPSDRVIGSELLTTIKEFARWHHLNEMTIAAGKTPSDSEIDFEAISWNRITRALATTEGSK